ncbi:hypothetical protein AC578_394 [Lecanosticta acicola]|uniref:F-box domain-containing protein n=1 Tax=Lecanosticta acicola TaxID=111012 RepID=A0AAI8Z1U9_9PEZI|nr:hypothetical protein AC578_394 [Lecanosticta acicola]
MTQHSNRHFRVSRMAPINELSVELLESIFAYLSMLELLRIRRVSKYWQEVIRCSSQLSRKTFHGFVPSDALSPEELTRFVCDNARNGRSSLDRQGIAMSVPSSSVTSLIDSEKPCPELSVEPTKLAPAVRFNPVFPSQGNIMRTRTKQFREPLTSSSSWLDMYLTQPPCNYAIATVYHKQGSPNFFRRWARRDADTGTCIVEVMRPQGVRARDVLEAAKAAQDSKIEIKKWRRIDIYIPGVFHV